MSYVSVNGVNDLQGLVSYVFFGKDKGATARRAKGEVRSVASYCSMNITDFINRGDAIKIGKGLKYGAISLVQSFNNKTDNFDYKSKADQQYVNHLGRELAHELYPNSECLVVTHADGKNHMLHNHIIILNYDYIAQRAVSSLLLRSIRNMNDTLMKEHDLSVIPKLAKQPVVTTYMTKRNLEEHDKNWVKKYDFDIALQRKLNIVLALKPANIEEYQSLLGFAGVRSTRHAFGKNKHIGLKYWMNDTYYIDRKGKQRSRERRRKASLLGSKYTIEGLQTAFKDAQKRPLSLTFVEKKQLLWDLFDEGKLFTPKRALKPSDLVHKEPPKQAITQQQVITQVEVLTSAERLQVRQQRQFFVDSELKKIKKKLQAKLDQQKAEAKRIYRETAQKIKDDELAKDNKNWALQADGSLTLSEYNQRFDDLKKQSANKRKIALNQRKSSIDKAQKDFAASLEKSRKELEQQAKNEITKPDPNFTQKDLHKDYREKSLADEQKHAKQFKKHNKKKQQHKKKDLNKDGIDDDLEGIIQFDGGSVPLDGFDTDLNDPDIGLYTTEFKDKVDTSATTNKPKQVDKPKTQKKKNVNTDNSLQQQALNTPDQPTTPNINDDLQY